MSDKHKNDEDSGDEKTQDRSGAELCGVRVAVGLGRLLRDGDDGPDVVLCDLERTRANGMWMSRSLADELDRSIADVEAIRRRIYGVIGARCPETHTSA